MGEHTSEILYFTTDDSVHLVCTGTAHEEYFDVANLLENASLEVVNRFWQKHLHEFSEVEHNNAFNKEG